MDPNNNIPIWRAQAYVKAPQTDRFGRWAGTEFFGFGGYDACEAVGTPEDLATEVAALLNSLDLIAVRAAQLERRWLGVVLEVEPFEGEGPISKGRELPLVAEERVPLWWAQASAGNEEGIFDAAYNYGNTYGEEAEMVGTAEQVAAEMALVLRALTREDVEEMQHGTARYFLELVIAPGWERK